MLGYGGPRWTLFWARWHDFWRRRGRYANARFLINETLVELMHKTDPEQRSEHAWQVVVNEWWEVQAEVLARDYRRLGWEVTVNADTLTFRWPRRTGAREVVPGDERR